MKVKRIVADVAAADPAAAKRFYQNVLGLEVLMDLGWIATYGSREKMTVEISFAREGGSGAPGQGVTLAPVAPLAHLGRGVDSSPAQPT